MGQKASDVARDWFADNRYQDYLYLHGLSVEMAEAMAEYVHKRIRAELGFAAEDDRDMEKMLSQGYRGSPLFVRLSGLPEARGPGADAVAARRGADRRLAVRRVPARTRSNRPARSSCSTRTRSIFRCDLTRRQDGEALRATEEARIRYSAIARGSRKWA